MVKAPYTTLKSSMITLYMTPIQRASTSPHLDLLRYLQEAQERPKASTTPLATWGAIPHLSSALPRAESYTPLTRGRALSSLISGVAEPGPTSLLRECSGRSLDKFWHNLSRAQNRFKACPSRDLQWTARTKTDLARSRATIVPKASCH